MKISTFIISLIFFHITEFLGFVSSSTDWFGMAQEELNMSLNKRLNTNKAKNVILFVGDGMGLSTVTAARILRGQTQGRSGEEGLLQFETFPNIALAKVYTNDRQVPDSAATATAFLCGVKSNGYTLGLNQKASFANCTSQHGAEVDCITDWFNKEGKSIGIVTTSRITHATPAAAYAKAASREWEGDATMFGLLPDDNCTDIASQLIYNNPDIRVLLGGGRKFFMPREMPDHAYGHANYMTQRRDGMNLINVWMKGKRARGYKPAYVKSKEEFENVNTKNTDFLLGLFSPDHMDFEADRNRGPDGEPSLAEMTRTAINILQKNNEGYFLMVEGARIDHGHHDNMAKRALLDTLAFEDAVKEAVNLTSEEDTLIIVTADHSHVFNIAGHPKRGNDILGIVDPLYPMDMPRDGIPYTTLVYGNGPGYEWNGRSNVSEFNTKHINYRQVSAVPLMFETHSGEDVPIYARGPMSHLFHGVHEQHYIAHVMAYAACVGSNKKHCQEPEHVPVTPRTTKRSVQTTRTTRAATKNVIKNIHKFTMSVQDDRQSSTSLIADDYQRNLSNINYVSLSVLFMTLVLCKMFS